MVLVALTSVVQKGRYLQNIIVVGVFLVLIGRIDTLAIYPIAILLFDEIVGDVYTVYLHRPVIGCGVDVLDSILHTTATSACRVPVRIR